MPVRTPINIPTLKDLHVRSELWRDEILYLMASQEGCLRDYFDEEYTYASIPATFTKILESWNKVFNEQKEQNRKIEGLRDEVIKKLQEIYQILKEEAENNPNEELKKDTKAFLKIIDLVEVSRVVNFIRGKETIQGVERNTRATAEFLKKDELEQKATELETKYKESQNCFLGFIEEHTKEHVKFVFQVPDRRFNQLRDYVFRIHGVYYEVGSKGSWERINHQNALITAVYSDFLNDFQDFYQNGFSGIIENSPIITPREEKCACPGFINSTNAITFICNWQPTYEVFRLESPISAKVRDFNLNEWRSRGGGFGFYQYKLTKINGLDLSAQVKNWATDCIYYLFPAGYDCEPFWRKDVPLGSTEFIYIDKLEGEKTLQEFLTRGIRHQLKNGEEIYLDLNDKHSHLRDHINCSFIYHGESIYQCKLTDLKIPSKANLAILSNPSGIIYYLEWGNVPFYWREQIKFAFDKSKLAASAQRLGIDVAKEAVAFIPYVGGIFRKAWDKLDGEEKKFTEGLKDTISDWTKNSDAKFDEQRRGSDNRQNERKSKIVSASDGATVSLNPQTFRPVPGSQRVSRSIRGNISSTSNQGSGNFSRDTSGNRASQMSGEGITSNMSSEGKTSDVARSQVRTSISYSFEPGKAVKNVLGSIPSWFDGGGIEKNYSMLDFALRQGGLPLQMRIDWNNQLFNHYANSVELKKEGHKVVCEPKAMNLLNKPGFHKYIPHMIEKDKNGYFSYLITRGIELYKNNPQEIWDKKLGRATSPNFIAKNCAGSLNTTLEETSDHISSEDTHVNEDGRSWLAFENTYLRRVDQPNENLLIDLIKERLTSGAPSLNSFGASCECFKRLKLKNIADCWRRHYFKDIINCNDDGTGDYMSAIHIDSALQNKSKWIEDNTEYFQKDEYFDSWDDEFEWISLPGERGDWLEWHGFPEKTTFDTEYEAKQFIERLIKRSDICAAKFEYSNWDKFLSFLGTSRSEQKIKEVFPIKKGYTYTSASSEEVERYGYKVSKSEYERKTYAHDSNYDTYAKCVRTSEGHSQTYSLGENDANAYRSTSKGTREFVGGTGSHYITTREAEWEYYVLEKKRRSMYYVEFEWKKKTRSASSTTRTNEFSLGKGTSASFQYYALSPKKRGKKVPPSDPFAGGGATFPSWKFNGLVSWTSRWITLDHNAKYDASIWVYKDINKGEDQVSHQVFRMSEEQKQKIANGGTPWQARLEQSGGAWTVRFNQYTPVSVGMGNSDDMGTGLEYVDHQENVAEIPMEDFGSAESTGVNQEESVQEQAFALTEILQALQMTQEQLQQVYTDEQVRQIEAIRIQRAEQQRRREQTEEDDETNWRDDSNNRNRNRNR